jgi:hypothetical protein
VETSLPVLNFQILSNSMQRTEANNKMGLLVWPSPLTLTIEPPDGMPSKYRYTNPNPSSKEKIWASISSSTTRKRTDVFIEGCHSRWTIKKSDMRCLIKQYVLKLTLPTRLSTNKKPQDATANIMEGILRLAYHISGKRSLKPYPRCRICNG